MMRLKRADSVNRTCTCTRAWILFTECVRVRACVRASVRVRARVRVYVCALGGGYGDCEHERLE